MSQILQFPPAPGYALVGALSELGTSSQRYALYGTIQECGSHPHLVGYQVLFKREDAIFNPHWGNAYVPLDKIFALKPGAPPEMPDGAYPELDEPLDVPEGAQVNEEASILARNLHKPGEAGY